MADIACEYRSKMRGKKRMNLLFITNLPSPYRVDFFNELGKSCDLTVCYERRSAADRDDKWIGDKPEHYRELYAKGHPVGMDHSIGLGVAKVIQKVTFDALVIAGYSSPSVMLAIIYCKLHHIPYFMEYDGGFNKSDAMHLRLFKQFLLCSAKGHFTTCAEHICYLQRIGIANNKIYKYPFTSLKQDNLVRSLDTAESKLKLRNELGLIGEKIILTVGRFSYNGGYGKGYDVLIRALAKCPSDYHLYIVGDEPTKEFVQMKEKLKLDNLHYVGFKPKQQLKEYYRAADLFCLQTRGDVWGLVINEAMAHGLPIITTDKCVAGLELVENGKNGYIVPVEDVDELAMRIGQCLTDDAKLEAMGKESLLRIQGYTIEQMAKTHLEIFEKVMQSEANSKCR